MTPGAGIAHYRIVSKLGEGGMGAVYRAHDPKLGRDVAIKVLPQALANDADYVARFQREAQVLASLNHPHIAAIYGLEDNAIVMELVEGREPAGPLPVSEVTGIARQMADALEAAHERGVIHRDLKPGNIKITADGTVKILDFGLAKAGEQSSAAASVTGAANSPTLTIRATQAGVLLGTAAYMAPEQAAGKPVDRRADIWAFGVVLWELITGRQLFSGETLTHTLAAVLRDPIDLTLIPEGPVRTLIARCLDRNLKTRLGWIGEARAILDTPVTIAPPAKTKRAILPWAVAIVALLAGAAAAFWPRSQPADPGKLRRYSISPPGFSPVLFDQPVAALSPDGERIAWVAGPKLWIRKLSEDEPRAVEGPVDPSFPFWSPDGKFVACAANNQIWKVSADGTAASAVTDYPFIRGTAWSADGNSFVLTGGLNISLVPVEGGPRKDIAHSDSQGSFANLTSVPGTHAVLMHHRASEYVEWLDLVSGKRSPLAIAASSAAWSDGWLIFSKASRNWGSDLWAVPFDKNQVKTLGEPVLLVRGATSPSVGDDGTLLYVDATFTQPVLRDRTGKRLGALGLPLAAVHDWAVTPDGNKVAVVTADDGNPDVWVIQGSRRTRITDDPASETNPVWTKDGNSLIWSSGDTGHLYRKASSDASPRAFVPEIQQFRPEEWSPDGKSLTGGSSAHGPSYLRQKDSDGSWELVQLLKQGRYPRVSPDGRYFAYYDLVGGEPHIFVKPFPSGGESWQISTAPSRQHRWSPDGKELYFLSGNYLMATSIRTTPTFQAGTPQRLFELNGYQGLMTNQTQFQVLGDGTFALLEPVPVKPGTTPSLHIVENWKRLLKSK